MKNSKFNIYYEDENISFAANTMTGACVTLDSVELANLKGAAYSSFPEGNLQELRRQGIIIDDEIDEVKLLRYTFDL